MRTIGNENVVIRFHGCEFVDLWRLRVVMFKKISISSTPPYKSKALPHHFFNLLFNSPNVVYATRDSALWFTDPPVGYSQGTRRPPMLLGHVYRFELTTTNIRVVVDWF